MPVTDYESKWKYTKTMELRKDKNGDLHKSVKQIATADFYYDLFQGGYIKPESILTPECAKEVAEAMETIKKFERFLNVMELIEEM
jgi:hypothetical protein